MKVYVMTRMNVNGYGFNPYSVEVSESVAYLNGLMKAEYLEKAREYGISEEDALADYFTDKTTNVECQFCENAYAYISFDYYWDIFETEMV